MRATLKNMRSEFARARGFASIGQNDRAAQHQANAEAMREKLRMWAEAQIEKHDHVCQGSCLTCAKAFAVLEALASEAL